MFWLILAVVAYFFGAIANVLDKFLLGSKRISSAPVYAFYIGVFSLGALIFAPFGLTVPGGGIFSLCLVGGVLFLVGTTLLYFAIERAEASRVVPVFGAVIPLVSFVFAEIFGVEKLKIAEIIGVVLLVFGGLLISFDLPLKFGKKKFFSGFYYALAAGFISAVAYLIFKHISKQEDFITWYVCTRVGIFAGACGLLFIPLWRKKIFQSFHSIKKNRRRAVSTSGIFVSNKIIGGMSALMLNYAIDLGNVTSVNALVSLQYVFVLAIVAVLSRTKAHIFREKLLFWDWAQKIAAIFIIGAGIFFIS